MVEGLRNLKEGEKEIGIEIFLVEKQTKRNSVKKIQMIIIIIIFSINQISREVTGPKVPSIVLMIFSFHI